MQRRKKQKGEPRSDLISRQALFKKTCDYEREALDYIQKIDLEKHEELVVWSAILAERTSFRMDVIDAPSAQQWIPCSARLPIPSEYDEHDMVLTCEASGYVRFNMLRDGKWVQGNPIAWMRTPEPYKGEKT